MREIRVTLAQGVETTGSNRETGMVAVMFLTWGAIFLARTSALYLVPFIAPEFHLTSEQVGLLNSVLAVTWAISGLLFGMLSDRIGRRAILLPCAFAFSILCAVTGLVHDFRQLIVLRALLGIAEGPAWPILNAIVKESSSVSRRGRNVGIVVSAAALVGLGAAPILTTQIAARYGWRWSFLAASLPGLIASFLILKYIKEPVRAGSLDSARSTLNLGRYLSILRFRNIWLCCLGTAGFICWLFLVHGFAPLYMTQIAHQSPTTAGFLIGATGLGSFILGFILPAVSDRVGRKPALIFMAVLSMAVPLLILVPWMYGHLWLMAVLLLVTNAGQGVSAVMMVLIPSETVRAGFVATAIGLAAFAGEIVGGTLAPIAGGKLAQQYGLGITMWMAAAGMLVVLLVTLFMQKTDTSLSKGLH